MYLNTNTKYFFLSIQIQNTNTFKKYLNTFQILFLVQKNDEMCNKANDTAITSFDEKIEKGQNNCLQLHFWST